MLPAAVLGAGVEGPAGAEVDLQLRLLARPEHQLRPQRATVVEVGLVSVDVVHPPLQLRVGELTAKASQWAAPEWCGSCRGGSARTGGGTRARTHMHRSAHAGT